MIPRIRKNGRKEQLNNRKKSQLVISTSRLNTLLCVYLMPINEVISFGPIGKIVLGMASRLDAFSGYHNPT